MKIFQKQLLAFLLLLLLSKTNYAQLPVNYVVEVVNFGMNGCNDSQGSEEEPTWKVWAKDDVNTTWTGGYCHYEDNFQPFTHTPASNLTVSTKNNTTASTMSFKFEAWEDDCGSRCSYESSCGFLGTQGDDDYEFQNPIGAVNFRNNPACVWHNLSYSSGCYSVNLRYKWEIAGFNGGLDQSLCDNSTSLSAYGNGEWSVFSGSGGSFSNGNDTNSIFYGVNGTTYTLLWESPSLTTCITNNNSDTVEIEFYSNPDPNLSTSLASICDGEPIIFSASNGVLYEWQIGTNGSNFQTGISNTYATDSLSDSDTIFVTTTDINGCVGEDSININVAQSPTNQLGPDITVCSNETVIIDGTNPAPVTYLWSNGATSSTISVSQIGVYELTVINNDGCRAYDSIELFNYPQTTINIGNDTSICIGGSITLSPGIGFSNYAWSTGETTASINVGSGLYDVTITDLNNCPASDTILIGDFLSNFIDLGNDSLICEDQPIVIDAGGGHLSYLWSTGETSTSITINTIEPVWVEVVNNDGCVDYDTIIFDTLVNTFALSSDTTIYMGGSIDLSVSGGTSYLWDNNDTSSLITLSPKEDITVWVVIDNGNGCYDSAYVNIIVNDDFNIFIPNMFSPNLDGKNDQFKIYGYGMEEEIEFKIYNRFGNVVYETISLSDLINIGWDGKYMDEDQPDGVYIWTLLANNLNGTPIVSKNLKSGSILLNH
jgi:gliding motility-associated-like protein